MSESEVNQREPLVTMDTDSLSREVSNEMDLLIHTLEFPNCSAGSIFNSKYSIKRNPLMAPDILCMIEYFLNQTKFV
jgi:hypothetical protein